MKNRLTTSVVLAVLLGAPWGLRAEEIAADKQKAIADMLAVMKCEVGPRQYRGGRQGLRARRCVLQRWGQYDMELNADLTVADKRKE